MYKNDVTENDDEEFMEVTEEILNASDKKTIARITGDNMEEMNDLIVTFGTETDDKILFEVNEKRFNAGTSSEEKEEQIDSNPKLEVGRDVGNALIAVVNDECELLDEPKHTTAGVISSNKSPAFKVHPKNNLNVSSTGKMDVEYDLDEIPEVSIGKLVGIYSSLWNTIFENR